MKKVAVVLSGCGFYDGAEVYEAVCTILALDRQGAQIQCFAPNILQRHVVNHLTGEIMAGESRNVLVEAARICRGQIKDLKEAQVEDFDALMVPGGYGAAKNLCDFAVSGAQMQVNPDFLSFAQAMHKAGKPIGMICIAPVMAAAICGAGVECTIGNDSATAAAIAQTGAVHHACRVEKANVDKQNKLVSTPAYMLAERPSEAAKGIEACVAEVLALA